MPKFKTVLNFFLSLLSAATSESEEELELTSLSEFRSRGEVCGKLKIAKQAMKIDQSKCKHRSLLVKLLVAIFLAGLAFRLLFSNFTGFSPELETPLQGENAILESRVPALNASPNADPNFHKDKCNLLTGDWIPNPSGPIYTNESCNLIESHQNCLKNGRPDLEFLYWRWRPRDCDLPQFDAKKFLSMMRNTTWALIGDSIQRNHVQSLICMLSTVEPAIMFYHDEEYKSKGWKFPSHNFTVLVIWSPFLVEAAIFEDLNGVSTSEVELQLDKLDKKWTDLYKELDYMIISSGEWFLKSAIYYENGILLGCHYCSKRNLTELGFNFAYRKALRFVLNFVVTSGHKGLIFFRTSTPDHFENGEWFSGGTCTRTAPAKGEIKMKDLNKILYDIEIEEFSKVAPKALENGVNLKLLDLTQITLLRPDGHPGPYREYHPFARGRSAKVQNDCLHWCLPGPIDSWNDVIMEMITND